jgi:hypothetical protein
MEQLLEINNKIKNIVQRHQNNLIKLNAEVWKFINGYENYEVSSFGRVRNIKFGKFLKPVNNSYGYQKVMLRRNNKKYNCNIHRLVAETFIDNPNNKIFVDHINGKILNNCVSNLRWASNSENQMNRKLGTNNTSGIKGVCWHKRHKKWSASVKVDGRSIYLGYFDTLDDAKVARQIKSNELFGNFVHSSEKL